MKYIKLKCNEYDCKCEFLIAINEWYLKEYGETVNEYYSCPDCEGMVWTEKDCVIEMP